MCVVDMHRKLAYDYSASEGMWYVGSRYRYTPPEFRNKRGKVRKPYKGSQVYVQTIYVHVIYPIGIVKVRIYYQ